MTPRASNMSLGEQCHAALIDAAEKASEAERLERLARRVFSQLVISGDGPVSQREHAARASAKYAAVEDAMITAQTAANLAKAEADGLEVRFREWASKNANARAEMSLR